MNESELVDAALDAKMTVTAFAVARMGRLEYFLRTFRATRIHTLCRTINGAREMARAMRAFCDKFPETGADGTRAALEREAQEQEDFANATQCILDDCLREFPSLTCPKCSLEMTRVTEGERIGYTCGGTHD